MRFFPITCMIKFKGNSNVKMHQMELMCVQNSERGMMFPSTGKFHAKNNPTAATAMAATAPESDAFVAATAMTTAIEIVNSVVAAGNDAMTTHGNVDDTGDCAGNDDDCVVIVNHDVATDDIAAMTSAVSPPKSRETQTQQQQMQM